MSLGRNIEHDEVQKRISDRVYDVVKLVGRRSEVWEKFSIVLDSESRAHVGYVQCDTCKAVLKFRAGSGTTHLKRHSCKDHSNILNRNASFQPTTSSLIDDVTHKCVMMCGKDLLPVSIVEREGFRELAQELIDIGATYGQISVSDVLPDHNAIACTVADFASRLRNNIIFQAVSAAEDNACAMGVALWQDTFRRLNYMSISVHYINKDWQIINRLLTTCTFSEIREIDEEFEERLNAFGISKKLMQKLKFVSNEEDNVKKALGGFLRLPCATHSISTVLNHIFDEGFLRERENALLSSINAGEIVVDYLKGTEYASKLEKTINQYSEDLWHRRYVLLVFVHEQIDEIRMLLTENGAEDKLTGYDDGIVSELICFLGLFKEAMDQLEGVENENEPTLQLVLLWSHKLKKHCEPIEHDSEVLKCVKQRVGSYLDQKVVLDPMHIVATFLWPSFRHLLALSDIERENTYENVRKMCSSIYIPGGTSEGTSDDNTTPPKRRRLFDGWHFKEEPVGPQSEVSVYLALNDIGNDDNLTEWWQERESLLPRLSVLARQVLCIPATCAASRVDFIAAGQISTASSPQQMDDLMLVRDNIQLVKEISYLKSHEFTSS